jgi:heterodisulfide reductase subunit B
MSTYLYFPGCSVKGTGRAYEESLLAVFEALGIPMEELEDWNCCGATAYMSIDEVQGIALAGRNLALAADSGADVVTPCNACWLVLQKAQRQLREDRPLRDRVLDAMDRVGLRYRDDIRVRHPLDVLVNDFGLDTFKDRVTAPLDGLKVAPYYGCQIVRPYAVFDDRDDPVTMDRLLQAAGASVVDYPFKTRCCGGSQTGTLPEIGISLVRDLMHQAHEHGADVIATICPLCQFNLEAHQKEIRRLWGTPPIPVVFFTQLLGLSLGLAPRRLGFQRSLVPVDAILERRTADVS